ncbi:MAG: hypothetical protein M1827_006288 [Pycnora praestabilis]|nr:MAG: hypothetical protein M1827_006288 [Pycnora praestabilis]
MPTCVACNKALEFDIETDSDNGDFNMAGSSAVAAAKQSVPDDVEFRCGCHYHWQCLLDAYTVTECPNCSSSLVTISTPTGEQQILCTLRNEGGTQENLDVLPLLIEDGYLNAYPEERKSRAFLEYCREGDVVALGDLLSTDEDEEEEDSTEGGKGSDILRYQDPIGDMSSGLHIAILNHSVDAAWLLLLLASSLPLEEFPEEMHRVADELGLAREEQRGKIDIRDLKDSDGRTAQQIAAVAGDIWITWANRLAP